MRIVGGELKGRQIKTSGAAHLRPSTEKTREAIFSVLGGDIDGADIADLFCGSGALGLEALSRGASRALFVELSKPTIRVVKKNVSEFGLDKQAEFYEGSVFHLRPGFFDTISIVFADPPYGKGFGDQLIELLSLKKIAFDGILVLEHEREWSYDGSGVWILRRLDFGDSSVTFFKLPARVINDE